MTRPILPLDLPAPQFETAPVKTALCLIAMMFCLARLDASVFGLNGDLTWNITEPQCDFRLKGDLKNLGGVGTGVIKLVLWATKAPYPSAGYNVAEITLGQLSTGEPYSDFTVKTKSHVPFINDTFYFTIAVVEYTGTMWRNVLLVPTGTKALFNGDFVEQEKWIFPIAPVVAPPESIGNGDVIKLLERATGEFNKFPLGWREQITLTATTSNKMDYVTKSRDATVRYEYSVNTAKYRNKKVSSGKLVLTAGDIDDPTFKNTISLFFQGPNYGTYKSVVSGTLWTGTILTSAGTWGTFKLQ